MSIREADVLQEPRPPATRLLRPALGPHLDPGSIQLEGLTHVEEAPDVQQAGPLHPALDISNGSIQPLPGGLQPAQESGFSQGRCHLRMFAVLGETVPVSAPVPAQLPGFHHGGVSRVDLCCTAEACGKVLQEPGNALSLKACWEGQGSRADRRAAADISALQAHDMSQTRQAYAIYSVITQHIWLVQNESRAITYRYGMSNMNANQ